MSDVIIIAGFQGRDGPPACPCRAATAAALPSYLASPTGLTATANGSLVVDTVPMNAGDDVLVKNEGNGISVYNLVYTVADPGSVSSKWRLQYKSGVPYRVGMPISVALGETNGRRLFLVTTDGAIAIGTTPLTFESSAGGSSSGGFVQATTSPYDILPSHTLIEVMVSPAVLNFPSIDDVAQGVPRDILDRSYNASLSPIQLRYLGVQFGSIDADGASARVYANTDGWDQI